MTPAPPLSSRRERVLVLAELIDGLIESQVEDIRRQYAGVDVERMRQIYRRGYFAGHAAGRRGAERVTNPERCARGELGELFR